MSDLAPISLRIFFELFLHFWNPHTLYKIFINKSSFLAFFGDLRSTEKIMHIPFLEYLEKKNNTVRHCGQARN